MVALDSSSLSDVLGDGGRGGSVGGEVGRLDGVGCSIVVVTWMST